MLSRYQNAAAAPRKYAERSPERHHPGPRQLLTVLGQNSTGQSTSTTLRNPSLAHKHDSAGSPVI
jgi:hypothetical protein